MSELPDLPKPILRRVKDASPHTRDEKILSLAKTAFGAIVAFILGALTEEFVLVFKQFFLDFASQIAEVPIVFGFSVCAFLGLIFAFVRHQELSYRLARIQVEDFISVHSRLVNFADGAWNAEVSVTNNHPDDEISITCNELVLARSEREHKGSVSGLSTVKVPPKHTHVFRFSIPCGGEQFSGTLRYTVYVGSKALPKFENEVLRLVRV